MTVRFIKRYRCDGETFDRGSIVDETTYDIEQMMDWLRLGVVMILPDIDDDRGAQRLDAITMRTPQEFSEFLNNAVQSHWGYVWGGRGKVYDETERNYLYKTYKTARYDFNYYYHTQWERWSYVNVADCSGLIEAFSGLNRTAEGFYDKCSERGSIGTFPGTQGYLLFRYSIASNRMVHVGAYDGDRKVIESRDSASGVVKTLVSAGSWTHWGKPDFIDFEAQPEPEPSFTLARELRKKTPYMRGNDVQGVQTALVDHGYSVGSSGIDGIYGNDSYNAVRKFQSANGLQVDGIVGEKTTEALGGEWVGK